MCFGGGGRYLFFLLQENELNVPYPTKYLSNHAIPLSSLIIWITILVITNFSNFVLEVEGFGEGGYEVNRVAS